MVDDFQTKCVPHPQQHHVIPSEMYNKPYTMKVLGRKIHRPSCSCKTVYSNIMLCDTWIAKLSASKLTWYKVVHDIR